MPRTFCSRTACSYADALAWRSTDLEAQPALGRQSCDSSSLHHCGRQARSRWSSSRPSSLLPANDVLPLPEPNPTIAAIDDRPREVGVAPEVRRHAAGMGKPKDGLHFGRTDQVVWIHLLSHRSQSREVDSLPHAVWYTGSVWDCSRLATSRHDPRNDLVGGPTARFHNKRPTPCYKANAATSLRYAFPLGPNTNRARSPRSISYGDTHFTPTPAQTFGILIRFRESVTISCVTTVKPVACAWATR